MSTRCQTKIEGTDLLVYRHCDGYPSSMLKVLLPFIQSFIEARGWDTEYMVAQLVHHLISDYEKSNVERIKDHGPSYTGYGVDRAIHGDIEYLYEIRKDGTLFVQTPTHDKSYGIKGFKPVAKFKMGTTYDAAMVRLKVLAAKGGKFEHIAD